MCRVSRKYVGNGPHEPQCRLFQETLPTFHQQLVQKKETRSILRTFTD